MRELTHTSRAQRETYVECTRLPGASSASQGLSPIAPLERGSSARATLRRVGYMRRGVVRRPRTEGGDVCPEACKFRGAKSDVELEVDGEPGAGKAHIQPELIGSGRGGRHNLRLEGFQP